MTTYLRITNWMTPAAPPMTIVVEAHGLKSGDPYDAVEQFLDSGFFVTYEVFEGEPGDQGFAEATMHAALRAREEDQRERNMAVGYYWWANALRITRADGIVVSDKPAPFSREDLAWVLRSVSKHENYKGQTISAIAQDGTPVKMTNGEVLPT